MSENQHMTAQTVTKKKGKKKGPPPIPIPQGIEGVVKCVTVEPTTSPIIRFMPPPTDLMSEIIPGLLFLGNLGNAQDRVALQKSGIRQVVTLMPPSYEDRISVPHGIRHHYESIEDHPDADIGKAYEHVSEVIDRSIKQGEPVLVHCERGISRSATIVIAYLFLKKRDGFPTIMNSQEYVYQRRSIINPNLGFQIWLQSLEKSSEGQ